MRAFSTGSVGKGLLIFSRCFAQAQSVATPQQDYVTEEGRALISGGS
jgi:hypothetical protein